jgi:hypothetical protein
MFNRMANAGVKARVMALMLLGAVSVLISSCYPDYDLTYSDYDTVITLKDSEAKFGNFKTFFMPDTIFVLGDSTKKVPSTLDQTVLASVRNNLEARGYQSVPYDPLAARPDLIVLVSKTTTTYVFLDYYYYYYWYPWGGWYPYGPGWGYYPPYATSVSSYSTGTVLVSMIDPAKSDTTTKRIGGIWQASANGLLGDVATSSKERVTRAITQMFTQSPYLVSTK